MLTVEGIRRWKPTRPREELFDGVIPGFNARADKEGKRAQALTTIYTRRSDGKRRRVTHVPFILVDKGQVKLEDVRKAALEVWTKARAGGDPAGEVRIARATAKASTRSTTFAEMLERYAKRKLPGQRRGREVRQLIDKHFVPHWGSLPLNLITRAMVRERLEAITDDSGPGAGRRMFEIGAAFFRWAVNNDGITESPFAGLRADEMFGRKKMRDRILSDQEWRALFASMPKLGGFPFTPIVELLCRTGLRLSEVAKGRWSEIDPEWKSWTIPAARMKNDQPFVVPLVPEVAAILKALPRVSEFMFSTTGRSAVSGFSGMKKRLDRLMQAELGETKLEPFVLHDIRRSARTCWSSLAIPGGDLVRELMLSHTRPELHQIYDQHKYLDEHRQGLEMWQQRLRAILEGPRPDTVVKLRRA